MANHGKCYKCRYFQPLRTGVGYCDISTLYDDYKKEVEEDNYCPDYWAVPKNKRNKDFLL